MKIAIIYSGLPSFTKDYFDNHYEYIFQYYSPDIYISTYSTNDDSIEKIQKFYQPKFLHTEDYDVVLPFLETIKKQIIFQRPETNPENVISMLYKIYRSFHLLPNNNTYDIIIKNRFDIQFNGKLHLYTNDFFNVPMGGDHHRGLMDLFSYGNYEIMKKYSNMFLYLPIYILEKHQIFHPEILLRHHCNINNLTIQRFKYDLFLRNKLFNNPIYTFD